MDNYPDLDASAYPLSRKVLDYSDMHEQLVIESKDHQFQTSSWRSLERFVDVDNFRRVGTFKELLNWNQYLQMLSKFGASGSWAGTFKGVTEVGNTVFLELEERCGGPGGTLDIVNTLSVFRFDSDALINHLDVYMQSSSYKLNNLQEGGGFRPIPEGLM